MTQPRLVSYEPRKDGGAFCLEGMTPETVASSLDQFFLQQGYRLEHGSPYDGAYGKGSDLLRIFLGGLIKRFKFKVAIQPADQLVWLNISKGMSGAMGGLLGYSAMKKETNRIALGLCDHFGGLSVGGMTPPSV